MTRNRIIIAIGLIALLATTWYLLEPGYEPLIALVASVGAMLSLLASFKDVTDLVQSLTSKEVEKARERVEKNPESAKPAWDLATAKLEAYLSTNLNQIGWIFRTSIIVMLVGFIFLITATFLALQNPETITPALVAGVGGVITEFIGATFLVLYRSAIEHSANYIATLDKTSSVGVAIQILDNISSDVSATTKDKIIEAKIEVAKLLLEK